MDEQFNYVPQGSGFMRVGGYDAAWRSLAKTELPIVKSGYLFVYLSNETQNEKVFFDNLTIQHYTGPLTEENVYYPFGLVMQGISSKAAGKVENKYKFNSIEQNNDFDINTYDAFYRTNDPQLGRWWQIDPKGESFFGLTPYNSMGNNPVKFNDPLGDIFDDASQKFVDAVKEAISERKKALNTQRTDLNSQIAEAKKAGNKDAVRSLKGQLKEVNAMRAEMNAASSEISRMESDKQLFMIRDFSGDDPFGNNANGVTTYSKDDKAVVMGFKVGDYASLSHELKHAYDFLAGEMSFIPSATFDIGNPKTYFNKPEDRISSLHDMKDEYRAFDRQAAFLNRPPFDHAAIREHYYNNGYPLPDNSKNITNTVPPKKEVIYKTQKN